MIIVQKISGYSRTTYWYALCREVRRTDKRVYVELVAGDSFALDGGRKEKYAPLDTVISENGTPELLAVLRRAAVALEKRQDEIDANARIAHADALALYEETVQSLVGK